MPGSPKNPLKPQALELRAQGKTYSEIGLLLNVNPKSVAGWVGNAKRKRLAKEARASYEAGQSAELAPIPISIPLSRTKESESGAVNKIPMSEQALRESAFKVLADGFNGKHVPKSKREWADKIIKSTSKEKVSISKGDSTNGKTVYAKMGDQELAERQLASACVLVGGHGADAIITRLKEQGQWYL